MDTQDTAAPATQWVRAVSLSQIHPQVFLLQKKISETEGNLAALTARGIFSRFPPFFDLID